MAKKKKTAPVKQGLLFSIAAAAGHVAGKINAAGGQLAGMAGEVVEAVKYKVNEIRKQKKTVVAKKAAARKKVKPVKKATKKNTTATKKKATIKKAKKAAKKAVPKKTARPAGKVPAKAGKK